MSHPAPLVAYHANCADGFTAAWAAQLQHPEFELRGVRHGEAPLTADEVRDRVVYYVDFCPKRAHLLAQAQAANSIHVLDHHKSAQEDLDGIIEENRALGGCPIFVTFDMARSGAMLSWEYFNPTILPAALVHYVQDRDLWTKALPNNDEYMAYVFSLEQSIANWDEVAKLAVADVCNRGRVLQRQHSKFCDDFIRTGKFFAQICGNLVPIVNCPYAFASEVGHRLLAIEPTAAFSATYRDEVDKEGNLVRCVSLRSDDDRIDVSAIAKQLGGGGHRNAAGFEMRLQPAGSPPVTIEPEDIDSVDLVAT
jgi:oligoribonuclease NrnB/cAMP/cGMP phosphodiesterase (DHH superfamily)